MKNKNGNKVIGAIKRSNGIKGVNGGTGAKGLNGSHVNGSHPGNGAVAGADKKNYRPTEKEPFMNERQRDYFRERLLSWREDILKEAKETLQHLQDENQNHPDLADRASSETDRAIELRARDRQRKVINKIDAALARIEDGTYGYCEETGEPIALSASRRARSPRCRSRRRSVTSAASASTATTEPRLCSRPCDHRRYPARKFACSLAGLPEAAGRTSGNGVPLFGTPILPLRTRCSSPEPDSEGRAIHGH